MKSLRPFPLSSRERVAVCRLGAKKKPPERGGFDLEGGWFGLEEDHATNLEDV
jgi:hypothetical protein